MLLGRPLATSRLEHERLGKPTALAVFSSDNMSSVAYATEEILRVLIPAVGLTAFALVLPISGVIVLIEAILIFSYRQTIKAYPTAGGAYIVTKDNLGLLPAQLAGVALLIDYVLTVSVSTAAGVQAISSVIPLAVPVRILFSLLFVWLIAYGNLLGVRESGRIFSVPTYLFIASLGLTCVVGIFEVLTGHVTPFPVAAQEVSGGIPLGVSAVTVFLVLKAFASGGAAVTGVEAISNGVPAFRKPEWRNAQITLTYMGLVLGSTFLSVSFLAHRLHVIPVENESKSVLAQIAQVVYGTGTVGRALFLVLQIATTLILILAANTSFADFPRLASFHAGDAFMPRQLTKRGHRLVFSNGVVALAITASLILVAFRASVTAMIPLYALGVFTSFTLSQTGMAKRHLRIREKGWRVGLFINGLGVIATLVVAVIIAIVKFAGGAWGVMVAVPVLVAVLVRVNKTYQVEEGELAVGPQDRPVTEGDSPRHTALVLVERVDDETLHAAQYVLTVRPTAAFAIHLGRRDEGLAAAWTASGLRLPLVFVPCERSRQRERCLADHIRERSLEADQVTVILPAPADEPLFARLRRSRVWASMSEAIEDIPNAGLLVVRAHGGAGHGSVDGRVSVGPRNRHVELVLVERLDRAVLKAAGGGLGGSPTGGAIWVNITHASKPTRDAARSTWVRRPDLGPRGDRLILPG